MKSNLIPGASLAIVLSLSAVSAVFSQQTVAIGDANPKTNAILYLKGNGNQGLIIPIVSALGNFGEAGMVVYNSTDKKIHYHDGSSWTVVGGGGATTDLVVGNEVNGVGTNGALILGGSGTAASPLTVSMISGTANGQILKWNNSTSKWELGNDNTGSIALNSAQILVGNASNVPTPVTLSGDATLTNSGVITLGAGSVNTSKILDGTITNADIAAAAAIAPSKIGQGAATAGQVLKWNGTSWAPAADDAGSVSLNSTQILVGNAANIPTATSVSGDATLSNTGALTIAAGAVNSAKILDGAITNADIAANAGIAPSKLGQGTAAVGQVLEWNGTAWAPAADDAGSVVLNSGQILVGNAANVPTATLVSGDATLSNTGALTLGTGVVNSAKILDGTIANADIAAGASIAGSKVSPAFVAQNVSTTGSVSAGSLAVTNGVTFSSLTGAGTRMVTTDATGVIGAQAIPGAFSTTNIIPKGDGAGLVASQILDDGTNIGIGTAVPAYKLDISKTLSSPTDANLRLFNPSNVDGDRSGLRLGVGDFWAVHLNTSLNGDWLQLTDNAGTPVHRWGYQTYHPGGGAAYIIGTGLDLAVMSGFMGVGTTSPDRKLDVSDASYQLLRLNSTSLGAGIELVSSTANDWMMTTWNGNFVLVQSTNNFSSQTDQYYFTTASLYPFTDNSKALGGAVNRWTAVYAVNGTIQTSDRRLKTRISNLKYGLDEVMALRPVSYSWKSDLNSRKIGLIAQDVQKIVPEVVSDEEFMGMNYGELVPVLINAIQEQQKKIVSLEDELKKSREQNSAELEALKAQVAAIKSALSLDANAKK
jgi:hypothetical protein